MSLKLLMQLRATDSCPPMLEALKGKSMSLEVATKSIAIWILILVLAVVNGAFREAVLMPNIGGTNSLILSGLILCSLVFGIAFMFLPWFGVKVSIHLIFIGLSWLILTLIFEFSFGLLLGKSIAELIDAYTFKDGNIWSVVLVVIAMSPWLAAKLRGWV